MVFQLIEEIVVLKYAQYKHAHYFEFDYIINI